jgi:hypothetical protein
MLVSVENLIGRSATTLRAGVGDFAVHEEGVIDTVRALRADLDGGSAGTQGWSGDHDREPSGRIACDHDDLLSGTFLLEDWEAIGSWMRREVHDIR